MISVQDPINGFVAVINNKDHTIYRIKHISELYTKQLINLLRECHTMNGISGSEIDSFRETIKTELTKRPHVMNKKESKAARILRIKKGR